VKGDVLQHVVARIAVVDGLDVGSVVGWDDWSRCVEDGACQHVVERSCVVRVEDALVAALPAPGQDTHAPAA